jgi:hypothetical protein
LGSNIGAAIFMLMTDNGGSRKTGIFRTFGVPNRACCTMISRGVPCDAHFECKSIGEMLNAAAVQPTRQAPDAATSNTPTATLHAERSRRDR